MDCANEEQRSGVIAMSQGVLHSYFFQFMSTIVIDTAWILFTRLWYSC